MVRSLLASGLDRLPDELIELIADYLDFTRLQAFVRISPRFRSIVGALSDLGRESSRHYIKNEDGYRDSLDRTRQ